MTSSAKRRWGWGVLLVVLSVQLVLAQATYAPRLTRLTFISGWLLFALLLLLTLYNGRKKLPFLPLGRSEGWLQFHIYAGFLTVVLFVLHLGVRLPTGWFEGTLAWLYVLVTGSGILGLIISRAFPKRMTTRGGEVIFEAIPGIRRALSEQAESLALKAATDAKASTITDFYLRHLKEFFDGPRNFLPHLLEVRSPLNALLSKIDESSRYLNEQERATMNQLASLIRQKDGLDYHRSLQLTLKLWLFLHIPLTYSLLMFSLAHIVLVFAFSGGVK